MFPERMHVVLCERVCSLIRSHSCLAFSSAAALSAFSRAVCWSSRRTASGSNWFWGLGTAFSAALARSSRSCASRSRRARSSSICPTAGVTVAASKAATIANRFMPAPLSLVRRIVPGDVIRDKVSENLSQIDEGGDSPLRRLLEPACRTASFDRKLRGPCPRCALLFIPPVVRDQSPADGGPACYPPYRPMYGRVGHRSARPVTLVERPVVTDPSSRPSRLSDSRRAPKPRRWWPVSFRAPVQKSSSHVGSSSPLFMR